jgi:hypothetical protein
MVALEQLTGRINDFTLPFIVYHDDPHPLVAPKPIVYWVEQSERTSPDLLALQAGSGRGF